MDKFDVQIENNNIIIKPKTKIIKILTLNNFIDNYDSKDFRKSKILSCFINNESQANNKYLSILKKLYVLIGNVEKIINNTKIKCKMIDNKHIKIPSKEAGDVLKEIINQSIENKIKIEIVIELHTNKKIKIINF